MTGPYTIRSHGRGGRTGGGRGGGTEGSDFVRDSSSSSIVGEDANPSSDLAVASTIPSHQMMPSGLPRHVVGDRLMPDGISAKIRR